MSYKYGSLPAAEFLFLNLFEDFGKPLVKKWKETRGVDYVMDLIKGLEEPVAVKAHGIFKSDIEKFIKEDQHD